MHLKPGRTDLPQLVVERRPYQKGEEGGDIVGNQTPSTTNHKQNGHHKHSEGRGSERAPGTPGTGDPHWEDEPP